MQSEEALVSNFLIKDSLRVQYGLYGQSKDEQMLGMSSDYFRFGSGFIMRK